MFAAEMNYDLLFSTFAFVFGACVGSFLNVCIYRLPLNLSVNQPRRSFCPSCKTQIPWHQNLPLVSWLALRGRCANCGARIAFRYFAVELLTAFFFLLIWKAFPWPIAIAYWVFIALVITATFIDFEHFIIPDEITIGGTVAGLWISRARLCTALARARRRQTCFWEETNPPRKTNILHLDTPRGRRRFCRRQREQFVERLFRAREGSTFVALFARENW
ncbi:MAG: hypothetical protein DMF16_08115 [Verrucomicrobia bacterium]|nr:MAG: hypothetical protein DMF16_08115 [Verrucomicrobiota bacterium]